MRANTRKVRLRMNAFMRSRSCTILRKSWGKLVQVVLSCATKSNKCLSKLMVNKSLVGVAVCPF